jgi:ABC-type lipoprotein export system ATPase subunit
MAEDQPFVSIRDLRFSYPGTSLDVLRIPALRITGRGLIALTGPSGAGKSTLVELLAGTLREPYQGSVQVLGTELRTLTRDGDRQRHVRRVGLIPQDYGLLPGRTVEDILRQDLADAEVPKAEHAQRIAAALAQVDLSEFGQRLSERLSGGQRQRVAIARMLARDVELVIADEPTANLDADLVAGTLTLLRHLAQRVPVVVVTHDARLAEQCDRTIVLQATMAPEGSPAGALGESASPHRVIPIRSRWLFLVALLAVALVLGSVGVVLAGQFAQWPWGAVFSSFAPRPTETPTPTPIPTPTSPPTPTPDNSPYAALIPGPGCDSGRGAWQTGQNTPQPTCTATGMVLTMPAHATALSEVFFTWPGHQFASNYSVRVTVKDFQGSNPCAGVVARDHQYMGYGIYACSTGKWQIIQYDAAGTPHVVQNGALPISDTYLVGFTVTGTSLQVVVGGQTLPPIQMDSNYVDTYAIPLAVADLSGTGASATFEDFVYAASP